MADVFTVLAQDHQEVKAMLRDPGIIQSAGDPGCAVSCHPLGEHPPNDRRRGRVRCCGTASGS